LDELCNGHRNNNGYYDCLIPKGEGKDSDRNFCEVKALRNMKPVFVGKWRIDQVNKWYYACCKNRIGEKHSLISFHPETPTR